MAASSHFHIIIVRSSYISENILKKNFQKHPQKQTIEEIVGLSGGVYECNRGDLDFNFVTL